MGKLQLAENGIPAKMDNYIFVPAGFMGATEDRYIREDVLDELPDDEYYTIMDSLDSMQPEMLGDREERRARRKAARRAARPRQAARRAARRQAARRPRQAAAADAVDALGPLRRRED